MEANNTIVLNNNNSGIVHHHHYYNNGTVSTEEEYDYTGAMKFTVTVVLVFGIGVIGILGFYHGTRSEDDSDKEAIEFVKRFERKRCRIDMQYRKREMLALVSSIITRTMKAQAETRVRAGSVLRPISSEPSILPTHGIGFEQQPPPPPIQQQPSDQQRHQPNDHQHLQEHQPQHHQLRQFSHRRLQQQQLKQEQLREENEAEGEEEEEEEREVVQKQHHSQDDNQEIVYEKQRDTFSKNNTSKSNAKNSDNNKQRLQRHVSDSSGWERQPLLPDTDEQDEQASPRPPCPVRKSDSLREPTHPEELRMKESIMRFLEAGSNDKMLRRKSVQLWDTLDLVRPASSRSMNKDGGNAIREDLQMKTSIGTRNSSNDYSSSPENTSPRSYGENTSPRSYGENTSPRSYGENKRCFLHDGDNTSPSSFNGRLRSRSCIDQIPTLILEDDPLKSAVRIIPHSTAAPAVGFVVTDCNGSGAEGKNITQRAPLACFDDSPRSQETTDFLPLVQRDRDEIPCRINIPDSNSDTQLCGEPFPRGIQSLSRDDSLPVRDSRHNKPLLQDKPSVHNTPPLLHKTSPRLLHDRPDIRPPSSSTRYSPRDACTVSDSPQSRSPVRPPVSRTVSLPVPTAAPDNVNFQAPQRKHPPLVRLSTFPIALPVIVVDDVDSHVDSDSKS